MDRKRTIVAVICFTSEAARELRNQLELANDCKDPFVLGSTPRTEDQIDLIRDRLTHPFLETGIFILENLTLIRVLYRSIHLIFYWPHEVARNEHWILTVK